MFSIKVFQRVLNTCFCFFLKVCPKELMIALNTSPVVMYFLNYRKKSHHIRHCLFHNKNYALCQLLYIVVHFCEINYSQSPQSCSSGFPASACCNFSFEIPAKTIWGVGFSSWQYFFFMCLNAKLLKTCMSVTRFLYKICSTNIFSTVERTQSDQTSLPLYSFLRVMY